MADVLIRGMEMPTCCNLCPCFNDEYYYCQAADMDLGRIPVESRHPNCPLIEVAEHGRLIDADALDKHIYNDIPIKVFGNVTRMARIRDIVCEAPTVIEASGVET